MNVLVQGKTLEVTKSLRAFIMKQAEKLTKVGVRILNVRVYLEQVARKANDSKRALVKYKVELPGKDIIVKRRAKDIYEAVVDATDSVVRQVRKLKEKRISKSRARTIRE